MDCCDTDREECRPVVIADKLVAEFLGTIVLVLVVLVAGSPIAVGVALAAGAFLAGPVSGGYLNPAVTLAAAANHRITGREAAGYMLAEFLAGLIGCLLFVCFLRKAPPCSPTC